MLVEAMQRLLDMADAWADWVKMEFSASKCWYFYETYQGRRAIHPDVDLNTKWASIEKRQTSTPHLHIPVQLDQLCRFGRTTVQLAETKKFLPSMLQQVKDQAEEIVSINNLTLVNALELLDLVVKTKALYVCKIVAVQTGFLQDLDMIIVNAAIQCNPKK